MITAGLDIGSTYTKCSVLRDGQVVGFSVRPTGAYPDEAAERCLEEALAVAGLERASVGYIVSTGYGRHMVKARMADEPVSEISANAAGSKWVGEKWSIRTIIDIGGQDTKVISLDNRCEIRGFQMNDKCAAGTGRFLELIARTLNVPIDELGPLSLRAATPVGISSTCTVFARSEVMAMMARKVPLEDIAAGVHKSIAERIAVMARRVGVVENVFFDGGPARNVGMRAALERELGVRLYVPEKPQIVTSIGAALIAMERAAARGAGQGPQG